MNLPVIVAVTATYRRPEEMARLLRSLDKSEPPLRAIVAVDNGRDLESLPPTTFPVHRLAPETNLGCGGGLRLGEESALKLHPDLTHLWILDDDTVVTPQTLGTLLSAMSATGADAAHPLVSGPNGELGWFPGLLDREKFRAIRAPQTPEQYVSRCGEAPVPFSWCQGIALLVTRRALDEVGFHRDDYWVRGEDLEFTLRITRRFAGILVPSARVQHLPPAAATEAQDTAEYPKHRAMLQNLAYTSTRLAHGRPLLRTLPGNWLRFLRIWGCQPAVVADAFTAFWRGAALARPAGVRGKRS